MILFQHVFGCGRYFWLLITGATRTCILEKAAADACVVKLHLPDFFRGLNVKILDKLNVPKLRPNLVFLQPKLISSAALANKLIQAKTVVWYQQSICSLQLLKTEQSEELAGWLALARS